MFALAGLLRADSPVDLPLVVLAGLMNPVSITIMPASEYAAFSEAHQLVDKAETREWAFGQ